MKHSLRFSYNNNSDSAQSRCFLLLEITFQDKPKLPSVEWKEAPEACESTLPSMWPMFIQDVGSTNHPLQLSCVTNQNSEVLEKPVPEKPVSTSQFTLHKYKLCAISIETLQPKASKKISGKLHNKLVTEIISREGNQSTARIFSPKPFHVVVTLKHICKFLDISSWKDGRGCEKTTYRMGEKIFANPTSSKGLISRIGL